MQNITLSCPCGWHGFTNKSWSVTDAVHSMCPVERLKCPRCLEVVLAYAPTETKKPPGADSLPTH